MVVIAGHMAETWRARCFCQAPFSFALQPGLVPTEQMHRFQQCQNHWELDGCEGGQVFIQANIIAPIILARAVTVLYLTPSQTLLAHLVSSSEVLVVGMLAGHWKTEGFAASTNWESSATPYDSIHSSQ